MFKTLKHFALPGLAVFTLSLCTLQAAYAESEDDRKASQVIAVVNGKELTRAGFSTFVNMRIGKRGEASELNRQQLNALLSEYINRELIYQDATARGWDETPEVQTAIENQRRNIVASYTVRRLISGGPSEKTMKQAYNNLKGKPTKEYKASHILVKTESQARRLIDALEDGATFTRLAEEHSVDSSSKDGGSLGWVAAGQLVEPLRDTLMGLETGGFSKTPVQSRFGWHVVKLDDTRIIPPPSYESVKGKLRKQLQNQQIGNYISQLRQNSKVQIK